MDNTANSLLNFFLDKSKSIGVKTALTISILGLLLLVDVGLNLSYNLSLNNKISQLERIQNLKKSYQTDSLKFAQIIKLENEILTKNHYSDFLRFDFSTENQISNTKNQNANQSKTATKTPNNPNPTTISTFWMIVSSNYSLILMWPFLILLPILPNQEYKKGYFFGWIALNVVWIGLIALIAVIAFQIPIIADNPTYNYWLNFGIHSLFLILIVLVSKKKK